MDTFRRRRKNRPRKIGKVRGKLDFRQKSGNVKKSAPLVDARLRKTAPLQIQTRTFRRRRKDDSENLTKHRHQEIEGCPERRRVSRRVRPYKAVFPDANRAEREKNFCQRLELGKSRACLRHDNKGEIRRACKIRDRRQLQHITLLGRRAGKQGILL